MRCREFNAAAKRAPNARSCRVCCREQVAGGVPCCCSFLTFCSLDICRLAVHTALIEFNVFTVVEQLNLQLPPRSNWLIVLSSTFLFFLNTTLQNTSFCPSAQAQSGRSCHRRSPLGTSRDGTGRTELFNCWLLLHGSPHSLLRASNLQR